MSPVWLAVTRAVHIGACLVAFGWQAFDLVVSGALDAGIHERIAADWQARRSRVVVIALLVTLVSGLAWLAATAAAMSGSSLRDVLTSGALMTVWRQTAFGELWHIRAGFWAVAVAAAALDYTFRGSRPRRWAQWAAMGSGMLLLGSLGWAGHGRDGPSWHWAADAVHAVTAGVWPTGLLPLVLLLQRLNRERGPDTTRAIQRVAQRFSSVSFVAVSVLVTAGVADSLPLVRSWPDLVDVPYGRALLLKIVLFGATLAIAAVNRFSLVPRLRTGNTANVREAAARLRRNVWWEIILGSGVIVIVGVLGILSPPQE